jgi:hypothetical protein
MTWDPEIDDPTTRPRPIEPAVAVEVEEEGAPAIRTMRPDVFAPIDPDAPVSGHYVPAEFRSHAEAPEHDWATAATGLYPLLRPAGTSGTRLANLDLANLATHANLTHAQPLLDDGPEGLAVVYAIASSGFDVITNADHLLAWGVTPQQLRDTAFRNLAAWSQKTGWAEEADGDRKLLSSASGEAWDAGRILLPEVRQHLASSLSGGGARVLVGLPDRDLLVASRLTSADAEFAGHFEAFVSEQSDSADEPIDRRVFELRDGQLIPFAG